MSTRNELIERVTQEVMKIYQVGPSSTGTSQPSNPGQTQTASSRSNIYLSNETSPQEAAETPSDCSRLKALVMVCGNEKLSAETVQRFRDLKSNYRQVKVLLSSNASRLFSTESSRPFAGFEYISGNGGLDETQLFDHFHLVNPTLNTLSKMAALQADTLPALVSRRALLAKKPVYISVDLLPNLPSPMMDEFALIVQKLVKYGYRWTGEIPCSKNLSANAANLPTAGSEAGTSDFKSALGRSRVMVPTDDAMASMIDHTLLKADATQAEIEKHCSEAAQYKFFSVCVNPYWIKLCSELLQGTGVKVCTVIGFPLGANSPVLKESEAAQAVADGADEVDMVINIGALKSRNFDIVRQDIEAVVRGAGGTLTKVILETALLTREEIIIACRLSKEASADFVKTATGFSKGGATVEHIQLMRNVVGPSMGVKASGGVRDTKFARELIEAGAPRIGASASIAIVTGQSAGAGKY